VPRASAAWFPRRRVTALLWQAGRVRQAAEEHRPAAPSPQRVAKFTAMQPDDAPDQTSSATRCGMTYRNSTSSYMCCNVRSSLLFTLRTPNSQRNGRRGFPPMARRLSTLLVLRLAHVCGNAQHGYRLVDSSSWQNFPRACRFRRVGRARRRNPRWNLVCHHPLRSCASPWPGSCGHVLLSCRPSCIHLRTGLLDFGLPDKTAVSPVSVGDTFAIVAMAASAFAAIGAAPSDDGDADAVPRHTA
jgi:hypothetical protein